jgi:hypothetical protein
MRHLVRPGAYLPPTPTGWREAAAAQDVEVLVLERGQPGHVLVTDLMTLRAKLDDGGAESELGEEVVQRGEVGVDGKVRTRESWRGGCRRPAGPASELRRRRRGSW